MCADRRTPTSILTKECNGKCHHADELNSHKLAQPEEGGEDDKPAPDAKGNGCLVDISKSMEPEWCRWTHRGPGLPLPARDGSGVDDAVVIIRTLLYSLPRTQTTYAT